MKKLFGSIVVSILCVFSFSVSAGPGSQINGVAVNNPADAAKIVGAFNARSVYRAIDAWMKSDTAKKFPGQMHLFAGVAGSPASHTVVLGYESEAEMEKWGDMARGSADLAHLLSSLQTVSEYHGASLSREVMAWGADLEDVLKR